MWNRISTIGLAAIQSFGPDWLKQIIMKRKGDLILSKEKCSRLEKLGENVGLNSSEVLNAIPSNTGLDLQIGPSCLTWCFSCIGFLILLFIGTFIMAIYPGSEITTTTTTIITTTEHTTYVPGTYYGTITPQDFKRRSVIDKIIINR